MAAVIVIIVGTWLLVNVFVAAPGWVWVSVVALVGAVVWVSTRSAPTPRRAMAAGAAMLVIAFVSFAVTLSLSGGTFNSMLPNRHVEVRHRVQAVYERQGWSLTELLDLDLAEVVEAPLRHPRRADRWVDALHAALPGWEISDRDGEFVRFRHKREIHAPLDWWQSHAVHKLDVELPTILIDDGQATLQLVAAEDSHVRLVAGRWLVAETYPTSSEIESIGAQQVRRIPLTSVYEDQDYGDELQTVSMTVAGPVLRNPLGVKAASTLSSGWVILLASVLPAYAVGRLFKLVSAQVEEAAKGWTKRLWRRRRGLPDRRDGEPRP